MFCSADYDALSETLASIDKRDDVVITVVQGPCIAVLYIPGAETNNCFLVTTSDWKVVLRVSIPLPSFTALVFMVIQWDRFQ